MQTLWTGTHEAPFEIHTAVRTSAESALIDVGANSAGSVELVAEIARTHRTTWSIDAIVRTRYLEVFAGFPNMLASFFVIFQNESRRAETLVGADGVIAGMRAESGILFTLVDVPAGFIVMVKLVTGRASADWTSLSILAELRTRVVQVRTRKLDLLASFIVVLQSEVRRAKALVGALSIVANVGAGRNIAEALVGILTVSFVIEKLVTGRAFADRTSLSIFTMVGTR